MVSSFPMFCCFTKMIINPYQTRSYINISIIFIIYHKHCHKVTIQVFYVYTKQSLYSIVYIQIYLSYIYTCYFFSWHTKRPTYKCIFNLMVFHRLHRNCIIYSLMVKSYKNIEFLYHFRKTLKSKCKELIYIKYITFLKYFLNSFKS